MQRYEVYALVSAGLNESPHPKVGKFTALL